ncbi:stalk domain-containing protein [Petroclostridium sp. X23]|uniref:stalk domain-containing protein n=1 Tax=Petroclostridium sp. X23 TaxID=3045146 RepID=UPI0024AE5E10|nr:stalk domain-containing protein [Petroclostridium sp. X23]WHH59177.1 stalk domain-containing protein [Petroclostridium sp. X23]
MKKFILGFLTGAVLFASLPGFAAVNDYILHKVDYKLIVNGQEYTNQELPILSLKTDKGDNPYVPLKAISSLLGAQVNWNSKLGQAEISSNAVSVQQKNNNNTKKITPKDVEYTTFDDIEAIIYNSETYVSFQPFKEKYKIDTASLEKSVITIRNDTAQAKFDLNDENNVITFYTLEEPVGYVNLKILKQFMGE